MYFWHFILVADYIDFESLRDELVARRFVIVKDVVKIKRQGGFIGEHQYHALLSSHRPDQGYSHHAIQLARTSPRVRTYIEVLVNTAHQEYIKKILGRLLGFNNTEW